MANDNSILNTVKKMLGITEDYTAFDTDIVIYINSTFSRLHQLGVGPKQVFQITGPTEVWSSFLNDDDRLAMVITYMYTKVKLVFDPPQSSFVLNSIQDQIKEYEWELNVISDTVE